MRGAQNLSAGRSGYFCAGVCGKPVFDPAVLCERRMPFFQTLYSGTAHAYRYQKKQGLIQTTAVYTGADAGRLAAKALHCIDQVFTADIAAAAVLGWHLTGTENLMERMEEVKKRLARLLAARLRRMEKHTEAADKEKQPPKEVEEAFCQLMLSKLSNYFQIRAAAALDASVDISREHARLYGKIQGESKAYGLEFSSAKLKLQSGKNQPAALVKGPETIFDRQGAAISYTDLEFGYTITHIEDHITEVVDGYESSVWLSGASNGALASLTAQGSVRLEFPVLYFPEAPVFTRQQFILEEDFTVRYSVTYAKSRHLPQVEDEITVIYQPQDMLRADKNALADAFAGFDCAGEEILQTLHQTATEVIAGGQEAQSSVVAFAEAIDAMYTLCTDLEKALQDQAVPLHAQIPGHTVSFQVSEGEEQGAYAVTVNRSDITPLIEGYRTEHVKSDAGAATYLFEKNGEYLGTADGQAILERTFLLPKEKIMDVHAATAQMYAKINGSLAEEFVMRTDMIAAGGIARADFTILETIDLHRKYKEPDLEKAVQKFLLDIGGSLEVSAECRRIDANGAEFPLFMQLPVHNDSNTLSALWSRKISQWLDQLPQALKKEACFAFRLNLSFGDVLKTPHVIVYQQYD
mgnify:FL=1